MKSDLFCFFIKIEKELELLLFVRDEREFLVNRDIKFKKGVDTLVFF